MATKKAQSLNGTNPKDVPMRQVEYTSEYSVFSRLPGNREIDMGHVAGLVRSMQKKYRFAPIYVNQDFQVLDGQHRLEAHRILQIPVPYYWDEGGDVEDVQTLNSTQKRWENEDYVKSFIERGYTEYKVYEWFKNHYRLPHSVCCALLMGEIRGLRKIFQNGQFKVKNLELAKKKTSILTQLSEYFTHWKDANFLRAMNFALTRKGFDVQTFIHKVALNPTMLAPCVSVNQYLALIEEVYNFRAVKKVPIRFGETDEKSKWKD